MRFIPLVLWTHRHASFGAPEVLYVVSMWLSGCTLFPQLVLCNVVPASGELVNPGSL